MAQVFRNPLSHGGPNEVQMAPPSNKRNHRAYNLDDLEKTPSYPQQQIVLTNQPTQTHDIELGPIPTSSPVAREVGATTQYSGTPNNRIDQIAKQHRRQQIVQTYQKRPYFTYTMMFVCTAGFLYEMYKAEWTFAPTAVNPTFGPPIQVLLETGGQRTDLITEGGEWWRLITPM